MTYRARIYLRLAHAETRYHYIGEVDLDHRPVEKGQIQFRRQGKVQLGRIEIVFLLDWDRSGVVPVLHVVLARKNSRRKSPVHREREGRG